MRIGGFSLFTKTNSKRLWNIAGWHSPHSMTWRWVLSYQLGGDGRIGWWKLPHGGGVHLGIRLPFVGAVTLMTQRPMWYRDCYHRARSQLDRLERRS